MSQMRDHPIVLAHGIARLDHLTQAFLRRLNLFFWDFSFAFDRLHYFKGIASHLSKHGFEVYHSNVGFASPLADRGRDLRDEILAILQKSGHDKVHIIGHSMGGLDGRQMIVKEQMAGKVASLTTIGTPHMGTSFADWGLAHGGHELIQIIGEALDLGGFEDLTLAARQAFNEHARNQEATNDVVYQTYAAAQERDLIFTPLQDSWKLIHQAEGENDGLVSIQSQQWASQLVADDGTVKTIRQERFPVAADHLNQIGWWDVRELKSVHWWRRGLFREKKRYETEIKNAYLEIARGLATLSSSSGDG